MIVELPGRVEREREARTGPQDPRRERAVVGDDLVVDLVVVRPLDRVALVDRHGLRAESGCGDLDCSGGCEARRRKRQDKNGNNGVEQFFHLTFPPGRPTRCHRFRAFSVGVLPN